MFFNKKVTRAGVVLGLSGVLVISAIAFDGCDKDQDKVKGETVQKSNVSLLAGVSQSFELASESKVNIEDINVDRVTSAVDVVQEEPIVIEGYTNPAIVQVEDGSYLNIRQNGSTESKIVGAMRSDSICELLDTEGEWARISSGDIEGYVKMSFLITGESALERANFLLDTNGQLDTAISINVMKYGREISDVRSELVSYALQFVGYPYVWGGTSLTNGTDCSGFTMLIYQNYGIYLPHYSGAQPSYGTAISAEQLQPGDLIFYGSGGVVSHVAIYIGDGMIVHASNSRDGIKVSNAFYETPMCYRSLLD